MEKKIELTMSEFRQLIAETITATLESKKKTVDVGSTNYSRKEIMKKFKLKPMDFAKLSRKEGFPGKMNATWWVIPREEFDNWYNEQNRPKARAATLKVLI